MTDDIELLARLLGQRSLILVGMMGAGKSSVGRRLADRLGFPFVDTDRAIEDAARMSVAEIFCALGEARFRKAEARLVARILATPRQVVALGGGAFVDPDTRRIARAAGLTLWLDVEVELLAERVRRRNTRPLLVNVDLETTLQALLRARRPAYSEADLRILSGQQPHAAPVEHICRELIRFCESGANRPL